MKGSSLQSNNRYLCPGEEDIIDSKDTRKLQNYGSEKSLKLVSAGQQAERANPYEEEYVEKVSPSKEEAKEPK